ncbi:uncharacterized protein EV420DRAFT_1742362 [Desarmillaria tabescens]|uniref:Uncharacterized protein n=1 Tax=Armillaria tabescens TaxID=1929756 RepID=A0AA39NQG5_ARMTA|nr:uncharacterized protein EV420DRAFT_1742362 [Desarmillaria tabescens]KAK0469805.1 hypothetical protein EV420DRAFT_1742362 [Desarmillaria tabescens]
MIDSTNAPSSPQAQDSPESLFGSPPLSPVIQGRSPSPLLALPGSSSSVGIGRGSAQNVGTIALPGSHLDSELPINPLALSLSYSPRPPAQEQASAAPSKWRQSIHASTPTSATATSSAVSSSSSTPTSSRSSSLVPNHISTAKRKKTLKRKATTYERPPPPEIPLPDPSEPPPSNFLRSQIALLGTAGLVAGVKPSTITHKDTRGMTSNNPIVIDDTPPPPPQPVSKPLLSLFPAMNSLGLSHPSNQEIVRILVRQKTIFPLLEEILKLIASGSIRPSHSWRRDYQPGSAKRRKLRHVPAGANDWDVPYPFARGEGPEEYDANWAKERCKQLVSQLVGLIKAATRKAALKSYLHQLKLKEALPAMYTSRDGESATPEPSCKAEDENDFARAAAPNFLSTPHPTNETPTISPTDVTCNEYSTSPPAAPRAASPSSPVDTTDFSQNVTVDQLLESLLAVSSSDGPVSDLDSLLSSSTSSSVFTDSSSDNQQWLFDSWMPIFESFQIPESGLVDLPPLSPHTENSLPFSPLPDLPVDFGNLEPLETAPETSAASATELWSDTFDVSTSITVPLDTEVSANVVQQGINQEASSSQAHENQNHHPPHDSVIDPVLLVHTRPCINTFLQVDAGPPSLVSSPMPSMSSMGDLELLTPTSSVWEVNLPDIASASGSIEDGFSSSVRIPDGNLKYSQGVSFDPETRKSVEEEADVRNVLPMLVSSVLPTHRVDTPTLAPPPVSIPDIVALPTPRVASREQLLKQANTRRAQIADAIVKARTALWETTIEGGVLAHLARYYKS